MWACTMVAALLFFSIARLSNDRLANLHIIVHCIMELISVLMSPEAVAMKDAGQCALQGCKVTNSDSLPASVSK